MIARLCVSRCPSISSIGTSPCGLSARYSARLLLVLAQVDLAAFIIDALEVERDADAVGGGRAPIIVEDRVGSCRLAYTCAMNGAMTSGGTRIGRPNALSIIAHCGLRANADFPVGAGELHEPVEPRALRRVADPGPRDDPVALDARRADNRSRAAPRPRSKRPCAPASATESQCATATCWIHCTHTALLTWPSSSMCSGAGGQRHLEDRPGHCTCVSMNAVGLRHLVQLLPPARLAAMAGAHVDLQQQQDCRRSWSRAASPPIWPAPNRSRAGR